MFTCVSGAYLLCSVRSFVILLGLVSFKYVAVSFVETIKSSAPLFTAVISYIVLKEKNGVFVQLSLIPIMFGLVLCTAYELSFTMVGFAAAIGTNIAEWYVTDVTAFLFALYVAVLDFLNLFCRTYSVDSLCKTMPLFVWLPQFAVFYNA